MSDDSLTGRNLAWLVSVMLAFFGGLYPSVKLYKEVVELKEQLYWEQKLHQSNQFGAMDPDEATK